jgi:hypothetical protein
MKNKICILMLSFVFFVNPVNAVNSVQKNKASGGVTKPTMNAKIEQQRLGNQNQADVAKKIADLLNREEKQVSDVLDTLQNQIQVRQAQIETLEQESGLNPEKTLVLSEGNPQENDDFDMGDLFG